MLLPLGINLEIDGFGLKLKLADVNANTMDDVNPLFHVMADVIAISWYCDSHYYLVGIYDPIYDHQNISGHAVTIDNFSIVGREDQNMKRAIKEAIYIRRNNPSLNKNIGKYHLPHIWDEVLVNITELQLP